MVLIFSICKRWQRSSKAEKIRLRLLTKTAGVTRDAAAVDDQIGEQDSHLLDPVGDHYLAIVQPRDDLAGQDIAQQGLYLCLSSSIRSTYRRSRSRQRLRSRQADARRNRTGLNGFAR